MSYVVLETKIINIIIGGVFYYLAYYNIYLIKRHNYNKIKFDFFFELQKYLN